MLLLVTDTRWCWPVRQLAHIFPVDPDYSLMVRAGARSVSVTRCWPSVGPGTRARALTHHRWPGPGVSRGLRSWGMDGKYLIMSRNPSPCLIEQAWWSTSATCSAMLASEVVVWRAAASSDTVSPSPRSHSSVRSWSSPQTSPDQCSDSCWPSVCPEFCLNQQ